LSSLVYSPGTQTQTAETPDVKAAEPVVEKTAEPEVKAPSLADEIRADRERRAAKAKADAEEATASKELSEVKAKLSKYEKSKDNLLLDSLGFLKELGLDDQEAASVAENIMFTLVPQKAPVDFRQKALEAQYTRDKKLQAEKEARRGEEEKAAREKAEKEAGERLETEFIEAIASAIPSYTAATHPASVTWFGSDHADYAESMLHTARNLAAEAGKSGKQADLSVANIAAVLEKKLAEKASRFKAPNTPAVEKPAVKPSPAPEKQPGSEDKKPEPKRVDTKLSDEERIRRAAAVVFRDAG
jgi:hypothetical protein